MGCFPTKKLQNPKQQALSTSLGLVNKVKLNPTVLIELKRGMTIGYRVRSDTQTIISTEKYTRHKNDIDCLTAEITKISKTTQEISEIKNILKGHFLFKSLDDATLTELVKQMNYYTLQKNEFVFHQADPGYNFFVISSGSIEISYNQNPIKLLERGDSFGEFGLLSRSGRRATAKSVTRVRLWGLGREIFKAVISKSNNLKFKENEEFFTSIEVFKSLPKSKLEILVSSAITETFDEYEKIFLAGELNSLMYVIKEGKVNIMKGSEKINSLEKGEYFGEISIVYNMLKNASAYAASKCVILCFTEQTLNKVFGNKILAYLYNNVIRIAIFKDRCLKNLTNLQVTSILPLFSSEVLEGRVEINPSEFLHVILWGQATEPDTKSEYKAFETIESSQIFSKKKPVLILDTTECMICKIPIQSAEQKLGGTFEFILEQNTVLKSMSNILFLSYISRQKLEELSRTVKIQKYAKNDVIFNEGDSADFFYIVKNGSVSIRKTETELLVMNKDEYFGERAFLFSQKRAASAVACEETECWVINKESFLGLLNEKFLLFLKKKISVQDKTAELSDFKALRKISQGELSETYLVINKANGLYFALKSIRKKKAVKLNKASKYKQEKEIHLSCNFPFISFLIKTFNNREKIFFLYEYIQGPTLSLILSKYTVLSMKSAKFYASVIVLIIEYLHNINAVHGNIKPSSFIIDSFGYPVLTEFSTVKNIENRSNSIVGVPYYIAPEVILQKGYLYFSDLWCLGVLIYEMLYGIVPFGYGKENAMEIYEAILKDSHKYPIFIKESQKPNGIIERLLQKDPIERGTIDDIKKHDWFLGVDWEDILNRSVTPEFIPLVDSEENNASTSEIDEENILVTCGSDSDCSFDF